MLSVMCHLKVIYTIRAAALQVILGLYNVYVRATDLSKYPFYVRNSSQAIIYFASYKVILSVFESLLLQSNEQSNLRRGTGKSEPSAQLQSAAYN